MRIERYYIQQGPVDMNLSVESHERRVVIGGDMNVNMPGPKRPGLPPRLPGGLGTPQMINEARKRYEVEKRRYDEQMAAYQRHVRKWLATTTSWIRRKKFKVTVPRPLPNQPVPFRTGVTYPNAQILIEGDWLPDGKLRVQFFASEAEDGWRKQPLGRQAEFYPADTFEPGVPWVPLALAGGSVYAFKKGRPWLGGVLAVLGAPGIIYNVKNGIIDP